MIFYDKNSKIISAGQDKIIKMWDIQTGELIKNFTGHSGTINSIAVNYLDYELVGSKIVSASDDKSIMIWDA